MAYTDAPRDAGVEISRVPRLRGYFGVLQTLARMAGLAVSGARHPAVQKVAGAFNRTTAHLDPRGRVESLRDRLGAAFEYVNDPPGVEQLGSPERFAYSLQSDGTVRGDCDDLAIWTAAIGRALNYPTRFVAIATGQHGVMLDHVLTEWLEGDTWVSMDTIYPTARRLAVHIWRL